MNNLVHIVENSYMKIMWLSSVWLFAHILTLMSIELVNPYLERNQQFYLIITIITNNNLI